MAWAVAIALTHDLGDDEVDPDIEDHTFPRRYDRFSLACRLSLFVPTFAQEITRLLCLLA